MVKENIKFYKYKSFKPCFCRCGCGQLTNIHRKKFQKFIKGHSNIGQTSINWKGGRYLSEKGYWFIYKPGYFSSNKHKYVFEHVYIFQEYHKCCILKWGKIHHKNNIPTDNRIENLLLTNQSNHMSIYHRKDISNRKCLKCKSKITYTNPKGVPYWHRYKTGFLCEKCFKKQYNE